MKKLFLHSLVFVGMIIASMSNITYGAFGPDVAERAVLESEDYKLTQLFPRDEFDKKHAEILSFYIVLSQPIGNIEKVIGIKKKKDALDLQGRRGLTALHVAVMANNAAVVRKLLESGVRILPDDRGWTPLHHAAIKKDKTILGILEAQVSADAKAAKDKYGRTYVQLAELITIPEVTDPNEIVFSYENEAGEIVDGSRADFKRITGADYTDKPYITAQGLINEWNNWLEKDLELEARSERRWRENKAFNDALARYKVEKPKLYLGKVVGAHYGVFNGSGEINTGEIITSYMGDYNVRHEEEYLMSDYDGKHRRNLGPMVNDGFPNCSAVTTRNAAGIVEIHFMALEPIALGEQIVLDYGPSYSGKLDNPHIEFRLSACKAFFEDKGAWAKLLDAWGKSDMRLASILYYMLSTPSTTVPLILEGVINYGEFMASLNDPRIAVLLQENTSARLMQVALPLIFDDINQMVPDISEEMGESPEAVRKKILEMKAGQIWEQSSTLSFKAILKKLGVEIEFRKQ